MLTYIEDHFAEFMRSLRHLSHEDQELLLGYYVLQKTQTSLALLHRSTQTLCSSRIRKAMEKMGMFIIMGPPTTTSLHEVFKDDNLEDMLAAPLSEVVLLYAQTRSFQRVAEVLGLHRPEVRRVMTVASKVLSESAEVKKRAVGAYIFDLIDKASASGQGPSRRKMAKQGDVFVETPAILGEFRIDVSSPEFGQVFVSRANR